MSTGTGSLFLFWGPPFLGQCGKLNCRNHPQITTYGWCCNIPQMVGFWHWVYQSGMLVRVAVHLTHTEYMHSIRIRTYICVRVRVCMHDIPMIFPRKPPFQSGIPHLFGGGRGEEWHRMIPKSSSSNRFQGRHSTSVELRFFFFPTWAARPLEIMALDEAMAGKLANHRRFGFEQRLCHYADSKTTRTWF